MHESRDQRSTRYVDMHAVSSDIEIHGRDYCETVLYRCQIYMHHQKRFARKKEEACIRADPYGHTRSR